MEVIITKTLKSISGELIRLGLDFLNGDGKSSGLEVTEYYKNGEIKKYVS